MKRAPANNFFPTGISAGVKAPDSASIKKDADRIGEAMSANSAWVDSIVDRLSLVTKRLLGECGQCGGASISDAPARDGFIGSIEDQIEGQQRGLMDILNIVSRLEAAI